MTGRETSLRILFKPHHHPAITQSRNPGPFKLSYQLNPLEQASFQHPPAPATARAVPPVGQQGGVRDWALGSVGCKGL